MKQTKENYFFILSIIFLAVVIIGFIPTFLLRPVYRDTALPLFLIVHGVVMMLWYAVYFYQSLLIKMKRSVNHQKIGMYWLILIILIYITGINVLIQVSNQVVTGNIPYQSLATTVEQAAGLVVGNIYLLTTGLFLFVIAFLNRTKPEIHKRAMLGASVLLLSPAWDRFIHPIGLQNIHPLLQFVAIYIFPISLIVYDIRKRRKPYWISVTFSLMLLLLLPIVILLINTGIGSELVRLLGS